MEEQQSVPLWFVVLSVSAGLASVGMLAALIATVVV